MNEIKSQQEADKVFNYLVNTTAATLNIPLDQAKKRVRSLLNSGILNSGSPDNPATQRKIDKFLQIPVE